MTEPTGAPEAKDAPCGCQKFCEHHDRDEIATDAEGDEFCNECAADGGSGELCTPSPQSCFPGDDKANEWERSFMCAKHAAEHAKFCAESDAEDDAGAQTVK